MRALVVYKKIGSTKKTNKSLYMRFLNKKMETQFIERAKKLGWDIKIFKHTHY